MKIYSIYDKVSQVYCTPFFFADDALALRDLKCFVNSSNPPAFLDDLQVYNIGEFSKNEGRIVGTVQPLFVCNLSDLKEVKRDEVSSDKSAE